MVSGDKRRNIAIQSSSINASADLLAVLSKNGKFIIARPGGVLVGPDISNNDASDQLRKSYSEFLGVSVVDHLLLEYLTDERIPWIIAEAIARWADGKN